MGNEKVCFVFIGRFEGVAWPLGKNLNKVRCLGKVRSRHRAQPSQRSWNGIVCVVHGTAVAPVYLEFYETVSKIDKRLRLDWDAKWVESHISRSDTHLVMQYSLNVTCSKCCSRKITPEQERVGIAYREMREEATAVFSELEWEHRRGRARRSRDQLSVEICQHC